MIATADRLDIGVYSRSEAAFFARVPVSTLNRWFYGNKQGERVVEPSFEDHERIVSFLDFVTALAIRNCRVGYKISMPKIREAIQRAKEDFSLDYPLAMRRTLFYSEAVETLFIVPPGKEEFYKITGKDRNQQHFTKVVEMFVDDLGFDADGLAKHFDIFTWRSQDRDIPDRVIRMRPEIRFGEPIILTCALTPQVLWDACKAEGSIEDAARAYGVEVADVTAAARYFNYLNIAA